MSLYKVCLIPQGRGNLRLSRARVSRAGKGYRHGYKLHLARDAGFELPLAAIAALANEKEHAPKLFERTVKASNGQIWF